jgi:PIN domain nuclease of toxin-antitoxin system
LPRHHDDPFDRMLVGQAQTENLTLVSADPLVGRYDVAVLGVAA